MAKRQTRSEPSSVPIPDDALPETSTSAVRVSGYDDTGALSLPPPPPEPVPSLEGPTPRLGSYQRAPLSAPPSLPGYEFVALLGRGGMGVVYKARHVQLDRLVALKMIVAGVHASADSLCRFRSEAAAAARLQHPHIVQIYEVGEHDGLPYLSLELIEGGTLAQNLGGTPLPARRAAELVETLARAMDVAHERGIVHRDLKPTNILLTPDGQPKIADFGLAKRLDSVDGPTVSGAILGTPSYMAPEQADSKRGLVGPAADIYALGAILYELLIGRPPFKAATALETVEQVLGDEPVPPRQLQSSTPRDLETICLKCLRKEPLQRYSGARALAEDLHRYLQDGQAPASQLHQSL